MRLVFIVAFFCFTITLYTHQALSQTVRRGTPEEAMALVKKVKKMWSQIGPERTINNVNSLGLGLKYKDLYPFIMHTDGYMVAHFVHSLRGVSLIGNVDDTTIRVFSRMVETVKIKKRGWVNYNFINPIKKVNETKSAYLELIENGYFVGVGVYKRDSHK